VLRRAGLAPIVLKGAALAYLAYPAPGLRTMADLDLLVQPDQAQLANDALTAAGYQAIPDDLPEGHHHLPPLLTPDRRSLIELHHHVLPEANPYAIDMAALWSRAQWRQLGEVEALVLAPEDALLHICVHLAWGHRYQWFPLRTLVDVMALTTHAAINWDLFVQTVSETRTAGAVYWPLRLSQLWLQARVPSQVLARLGPAAPLHRVMQVVIESPYVLNANTQAPSSMSVLYGVVREMSLYSGCSFREQAGSVWRSLFPHPEDVMHLPPEVSRSRLRYALHLLYPPRLVRGLIAAGVLIARLLGQAVDTVGARQASGAARRGTIDVA
jgi:hypothetical protein